MNKIILVAAIGLLAAACGAAPNVPGSEDIPTGGNETMEGVQDQVAEVEDTVDDVVGTAEATAAIGLITQGYAEFNAHGEVSNIAENAMWQWADADHVEGNEAIQATMQGYYDAMPDIMIYPERMMSDGEIVVAQVIVRGTNTGDMGEMAATGLPVGQRELHVFQIVDGEVANAWIYQNQMTMMAQLGAFEVPAEIPTPEIPEGEPEIIILPGAEDNATLAQTVIDAAVLMDIATMSSAGAEGAVVHNHMMNVTDLPWADHVAGWEEMAGEYDTMAVDYNHIIAFGDNWAFASYTAMAEGGGEPMSVQVAQVFHIADGQIHTQWTYGNGMAMMPAAE